MASKKETKLDGVVFNPFSNNLIFKNFIFIIII